MNQTFRVNAAGCSLVDNLYGRVSFDSDIYKNLSSRKIGDGGLPTGGLTFAEALTSFAGKTKEDYPELLSTLSGGIGPDNSNIGGPGIVPIIHAAQVRRNPNIKYRFSGVLGRDENGRRITSLMEKAGFPMDDYFVSDLATPCTDVLSDPTFDGGRGERTFINTIGAAAAFSPEFLPPDFFDAEVLLFGATALVPPLHDALDTLCRRGREAGAFVMVSTVFDFRNEARMKGRPWPFVNDYGNIDLLAMDREESLKISGRSSPDEAALWFLEQGCGAVVITQGADNVLLRAGKNGPFAETARTSMPTCRYADEVVASLDHPRDTTGCGDNFVGGLIDSVAHQLAGEGAAAETADGTLGNAAKTDAAESSASRPASSPAGKKYSETGRRFPLLNLEEAVISGTAAGSFALTCLGGVYYEKKPGEKLASMKPYLEAYRRELKEMSE